MKHIVNTHNELLEKVNELVKDGYRQTDVTEYEIVFSHSSPSFSSFPWASATPQSRDDAQAYRDGVHA